MSLRRRYVGRVGLSLSLAAHLAFAQPDSTIPAPGLAAQSSAESQRESAPQARAPVGVIAPDLAQGATPNAAPGTKVLTQAAEPEAQWYGWQTLTADALSIAAVAGGLWLNEGYLGLPGLGGYLFAAPGIHWHHGALARGFASLGMRFGSGALFVIGGAACAAGALNGGREAVCGLPVVGLLMIPAAIAVDATLAWEKASTDGASPRQLAPWFSATRRAGGVVWQGTF